MKGNLVRKLMLTVAVGIIPLMSKEESERLANEYRKRDPKIDDKEIDEAIAKLKTSSKNQRSYDGAGSFSPEAIFSGMKSYPLNTQIEGGRYYKPKKESKK